MKTSYEIGVFFEQQTLDVLQKEKHSLLGKRIITRSCEIDLLTLRDNCIFLTEVKYRKQCKIGLYVLNRILQKRLYNAYLIWLQTNMEYLNYDFYMQYFFWKSPKLYIRGPFVV